MYCMFTDVSNMENYNQSEPSSFFCSVEFEMKIYSKNSNFCLMQSGPNQLHVGGRPFQNKFLLQNLCMISMNLS